MITCKNKNQSTVTAGQIVELINSGNNRLFVNEFEQGKANGNSNIFIECTNEVDNETEYILGFAKRFVQFIANRKTKGLMPIEEMLSISINWWGDKNEPPFLQLNFPLEYTRDVYKIISDAKIGEVCHSNSCKRV